MLSRRKAKHFDSIFLVCRFVRFDDTSLLDSKKTNQRAIKLGSVFFTVDANAISVSEPMKCLIIVVQCSQKAG